MQSIDSFAGCLARFHGNAQAVNAGLPDVDSISHWGMLSGNDDFAAEEGSPGPLVGLGPRRSVHLSALALVNGTYKLVTGVQVMSGWTGSVTVFDSDVRFASYIILLVLQHVAQTVSRGRDAPPKTGQTYTTHVSASW
jgi:hypothetical protein